MDISDYKIQKEIGKGTLSTVYLATKESTGQQVALKIFLPIMSSNAVFKKHFDEHVAELIKINHSSCAKVYEGGFEQDHCYIAMEYFPGTLKHRLLVGFSGDKSIALSEEVAEGLAYIHNQGLVHRNIKPSNIFLRDDGTAALAEVDIPKAIKDQTDNLKLPAADTAETIYICPEQAKGKKADNRSDFYYLGLVLFELLAGHPPYRDKDLKQVLNMHVNDPVPSIGGRYKHFQGVINQLLVKSPQQRVCNSRQFNEAVKSSHQSEPATEEVEDEKKSSSGKLIAIVVVIGLVVVGAMFMGGEKEEKETEVVDKTITETQDEYIDYDTEQQIDESVNEIENLLDLAEKQIEAGYLIAPSNDNAYETYQSVLQLEPDNDRAKSGLIRVADFYKKRVRSSYETGSLNVSQQLIKTGLEKFPDNQGLLKLQGYVNRRLDDTSKSDEKQKKTRDEVGQLVARAKKQISDNHLTTPPGNNAYESYQDIALIVPTEGWAQAGYQKIADIYEKQANENIAAGNIVRASKMIKQGLMVMPSHPSLLSLKQSVDQKLTKMEKERRQKERKVRLLLEKANEQLATFKWISPNGDNAFESYQNILKIDPYDERALKGIRRIGDRYVSSAKAKLRAGKLDGALSTVDSGLEVSPENRGLKALKVEINNQIAEQKRIQQRQQQQQKKQSKQIAKYIDDANTQIKKVQLGSAYRTYEKLKQLAPKDQRIVSIYSDIVSKYLSIAKSQNRKGNLNKSLNTINQGLKISPGNGQLKNLRNQINKKIANQKARVAAQKRKQQEAVRIAEQKRIAAERIRQEQERKREAEEDRIREAEKPKVKEEIITVPTF